MNCPQFQHCDIEWLPRNKPTARTGLYLLSPILLSVPDRSTLHTHIYNRFTASFKGSPFPSNKLHEWKCCPNLIQSCISAWKKVFHTCLCRPNVLLCEQEFLSDHNDIPARHAHLSLTNENPHKVQRPTGHRNIWAPQQTADVVRIVWNTFISWSLSQKSQRMPNFWHARLCVHSYLKMLC